MKHLARFTRSKDGAIAIEYALIAGLVSIAIVATLGVAATSLGTFFGRVAESVAQAAGS